MKFKLIERDKSIHKEIIDNSQPFLPNYDLKLNKEDITTVYIARDREGINETNNI